MQEYKVKSVNDKNNINWEEVDRASVNLFKWTDNYKPETYAQVVLVPGWGLVCKMTCYEANPLTTCVEDGQAVHEDSCMEFFVSFDGKNYMNFEANSDAVKKICIGPDRGQRENVWITHPGYFEVSSFRSDDHWSLIYLLPFSGVKELYPDFDESSMHELRANFYHMGANPDGEDFYYAMWNEVMTDTPDYHVPEYFGKLVF